MYICDKCCFYNKCYPKTMNAYDELMFSMLRDKLEAILREVNANERCPL